MFRILLKTVVINISLPFSDDDIGGVKVSIFTLSAVDHVFEPFTSQTKDLLMFGLICFSSKHALLIKE
jgi:hypothetical protein